MAIPSASRPSPIPQQNSFVSIVGKDGNPSQPFLQAQEKLRAHVNGSGRMIPCSASGTNLIALTLNDAAPRIEKYVFGDVFCFWAAETSTDAIFLYVTGASQGGPAFELDTLAAFSPRGVALGVADIEQNCVYKAMYSPVIDAGTDEGFVVSLF